MRFVSTTSRTPPILPSLGADCVNVRLNLLVALHRLPRALLVRFRQHRVEPLSEQTIQENLLLLRRKLTCQLANLVYRDGNRQCGHDNTIFPHRIIE